MFTILVGLLALAGPGAGFAAAQEAVPAPGPGGNVPGAGAQLPENFPADLRKYVGGTQEFQSAEWFNGPCAERGGDIGSYVGQVLANENRLMYWPMSDENKTQYLSGAGGSLAQLEQEQQIRKAVAEGREPSAEMLPKVFPDGNGDFHPQSPMCVDDIKQWGTSSTNVWGMEWASKPDAASAAAMKAVPGGDKIPEGALSDPCGTEGLGLYCAHAFFLDCDKAEGPADGNKCTEWNARIGTMFAGTADWIDQNTTFADRVGGLVESTPMWRGGEWVVSAMSDVLGAVVDAVAFIADPTSIADDWSNEMKEAATGFTTSVLESMAAQAHFDVDQDWFLDQYAVSVALGFLVNALFVLLAILRTQSKKMSAGELGESLFGYLPLSLFAAMFAPLLSLFVLEFTGALTSVMAKLGGQSSGELLVRLGETKGLTGETVPGGAVVGLVMFFLMLLGAGLVYIGLQFHQYGIPLTLVVTAISVGMLVHPKFRGKALRPAMVFLGLAFSVPLLFFCMAVIYSAADAAASRNVDGALSQVNQVVAVAIAMILVGLAPWGLLKWAPILPTSADSEDFGSGGSNTITGDTVGSAGNMMMYTRSGGGGGVGGSAPTERGDSGGDGAAGPQGPAGSASGGPHQASQQGQASGPSQRTDHASAPVGGHEQLGGAHGAAEGGHGAAHGAEHAGARGAGGAAVKAGSGAASGAATMGASVALQAASAAINKSRTAADDAAVRSDN